MQRFIEVFTRAPRYLSSTARLFSRNRLLSTPYAMAWSCRSHSPPWSQIGQSSGWLMSRNSITPSRAFLTSLDLVLTSGGSPLGPGRQSRTPQAQLATGLGEPTSSTRHMRQLPAIDSRSWKQKRGISAPAASHACSSVNSAGTSISLPSTMSLVIAVSSLSHLEVRRGDTRLLHFCSNPLLGLGAAGRQINRFCVRLFAQKRQMVFQIVIAGRLPLALVFESLDGFFPGIQEIRYKDFILDQTARRTRLDALKVWFGELRIPEFEIVIGLVDLPRACL